jgi:hypothetical protein
MMSAIYDPRTHILLPPLNVLLSRHYLPTITHPSEITTSLVIALYESLIHTRLAAIDRKDKSSTTQIRNIKLLLGEMVMAGWDVGLIDPVGVVEREEACLMDLVEVLVEIGREQYGVLVTAMDTEGPMVSGRKELTTISEASVDSDDNSETSASTLRPIRQRADAILSRIHTLNPSLRPPSPSNSVVSRATQTSPPPREFATPRPVRRRMKPTKRTPKYPRQRLEKSVQTDDDTESGIPSSIPLSYSSDSSPSTYPPQLIRNPKSLTRLRNRHLFAPHIRSPVRPQTHLSSSESHFRVDSPYTAALRRRRQLAIDSLRKTTPQDSRGRRHRIRVFSVGRDVADSTFAEDSDPSTPLTRRRRRTRKNRRFDPESTTDGLTDLEKRVKALRIWGGIEEERKEWLVNEIQKRKTDKNIWNGVDGSDGSGFSHSRSQSGSSTGSVSKGSNINFSVRE